MALPTTGVWEIRTTGADDQGGGYNPARASPGPDYSQQDAAQVTFTDLVIDGADSTKVTSALNPFTSDHIANYLQINSGTGYTAGVYEVTSVASNVATLDRSAGTTGSTGGAGKLGGAMASPGKVAGVQAASNIKHVKSGTYTFGSTANVSGGRISDEQVAATDKPGRWIGYGTTREDGGTKPVFRSGASSITLATQLAASNYYENIQFERNTGSHTSVRGVLLDTNQGKVRHCKFVDLDNTGCRADGLSCTIEDSEATGCSTGFAVNRENTHLSRCTMTSCNIGLTTGGSASGSITYSIAYGNTTDGFSLGTPGCHVEHCTAYNNGVSSGSGFNLSAGIAGFCVNCLSVGNFAFGFDTPGLSGRRLLNCAAFDNTSGDYNTSNFSTRDVIGFISLTADPFVNAAGGNFKLNSVPGGGRLVRGAGLPQTFAGLPLTTSRPDVGAVQHGDADVPKLKFHPVSRRSF